MQTVVATAIGGENVTTTIEGRKRYPVNVRYPRELLLVVGSANSSNSCVTGWKRQMPC